MMTHTKAPWRLNAGDETVVMAGSLKVARAYCGGLTAINLEEAEANARLIAAAPDLLAALKPFADLVESAKAAFSNDRVSAGNVCRSSVSFTDFERAFAAIAKATQP
jgi:hypothetical protein